MLPATEAAMRPIVLVVVLGAALFAICGMRLEMLREHDEPRLYMNEQFYAGSAQQFRDIEMHDGRVNVIPKASGTTLTESAITDDGAHLTFRDAPTDWEYLTFERCGYGNATHVNCAYGFPLLDRVCQPPEPCE